MALVVVSKAEQIVLPSRVESCFDRDEAVPVEVNNGEHLIVSEEIGFENFDLVVVDINAFKFGIVYKEISVQVLEPIVTQINRL